MHPSTPHGLSMCLEGDDVQAVTHLIRILYPNHHRVIHRCCQRLHSKAENSKQRKQTSGRPASWLDVSSGWCYSYWVTSNRFFLSSPGITVSEYFFRYYRAKYSRYKKTHRDGIEQGFVVNRFVSSSIHLTLVSQPTAATNGEHSRLCCCTSMLSAV